MWKSKKHVVDIKVDNNGFHDEDGEQDGIGLGRQKVQGYLKETSEDTDNGMTIPNGSVTTATEHKNGIGTMVLEDGEHTPPEITDEENSKTQIHSNGTGTVVASFTDSTNNNGISTLTKKHPLWVEIDRVTMDQIHYAKLGVGEGGWSLFAKEGEMKMYKREEEDNGLIMDPLKAVHTVKGVTAHEMCHYFFSPDVRTEWETTLDAMTILETISEDTVVFHQIHTRIWPATQRDALFWSHIRQVPDGDGQNNTWIVCNHSSKHEKDPEATGTKSKNKYIRILLKVSLVCQTVIDSESARNRPDGEIRRDDLTCHINYCSVVNPGGWAPASGVRAVYKREYPRFLKKFTQYVMDKCKDKPIMF